MVIIASRRAPVSAAFISISHAKILGSRKYHFAGWCSLSLFTIMGKLKEVHIRWIGIFLVAILATLNDGDDHMADEPLWFHYFVSLCFTAVYWNGAWAIIHFFRRRFPKNGKTVYSYKVIKHVMG